MPPDGFHHITECHLTKLFYKMRFASTGFDSWEARRTLFLWNIENKCCPCDYWLHWWIGLRLFKEFTQDATWWFSPLLHRMSPNKGVFYCSVCQHWISLMGGKKGTLFLQNIEKQCCACDYWLHWWIGLRLFMEFAQDATWCFSPLHRMSPKKGVFYCSVCQHWISLMGSKKDLVSTKYWKSMLSLWLLIALMDRVKFIHGVCTGCHLMVLTTSQNVTKQRCFLL
jgi:hypothetical protein